MMYPCPMDVAHDPHFWVSALIGGVEGSVPMLGFTCPGVEALEESA